MWKMKIWAGANIFLLAIICVSLSCSVSASVSYDNKAITINGQRRILLSGSIHYPRSTPEMWPDLIAKAKDSGLDVIQTYVFWNGHEPSPRKYYFEGRYDLIKFIKLVQQAGLYVHLRIGPYVCAEWNFGGFPVWLKYVPGIEFRTDNEPFKENMARFTWKIVDMMKVQKLFQWQGGPIILAQIENEYGPVEWKIGAPGKAYTKWAAQLALDTKAGVPWIMCKQDDAPDPIINTCNGFYCEEFVPNSKSKPKMWTENWIGWFTQWGGAIPYRPAEDVAYAVARFIQNGGSYMNYYMVTYPFHDCQQYSTHRSSISLNLASFSLVFLLQFHGGTNFGNTAGLFITTSYDYDAPVDEYGLPREPKYTHLKLLHKAIKMCEPALVSADPTVTKLGDNQEAHVFSSSSGSCAAFLANYDSQWSVNVTLSDMQYELPPWSVSILPDCKREIYNTARVTAPRIYSTMTPVSSFSWQSYIDETPTADDDSTFSATRLYEQVNVTRDYSDYLWYMTDVTLGANDLGGGADPILSVVSAGHALHVFVNGQLQGSVYGSLEKPQLSFSQKVPIRVGINKISLLSVAVGLANYGVHFETYNQGVLGPVTLKGLSGEDTDLTGQTWSYKVGMKGEQLALHTITGSSTVEWQASQVAQKQCLTWYKTTFNAPAGNDPLALDMSTMGKGQIWVNGQSIGRHWIANPAHGHCGPCNYVGLFNGEKCLSDCGQPSQRWYHVPRAWLQPSGNFLVVFEEWGGDPSGISLVKRTVN